MNIWLQNYFPSSSYPRSIHIYLETLDTIPVSCVTVRHVELKLPQRTHFSLDFSFLRFIEAENELLQLIKSRKILVPL